MSKWAMLRAALHHDIELFWLKHTRPEYFYALEFYLKSAYAWSYLPKERQKEERIKIVQRTEEALIELGIDKREFAKRALHLVTLRNRAFGVAS